MLAVAGPGYAQGDAERTIGQYTCKDVMHERGANRDVAIAFVHGYLLGKSNGTKFNIDTLQKQTDAFVDHCLDNPKDNALETMINVKK
jgi:hypothetical protein